MGWGGPEAGEGSPWHQQLFPASWRESASTNQRQGRARGTRLLGDWWSGARARAAGGSGARVAAVSELGSPAPRG